MTDDRAAAAAELRDLASDPRYSGRSEDLQALASALDDEEDASWTGVDLIGAFSPGSTILVAHRHFLERIMGMFAGVSVFLPVAWTWYSLHLAVEAYRAFITAEPEDRRTFLALWTTGFDGRLDEQHHLVALAMQSFLLIMLAVACIVLHRMAAEFNVAKEERATSAAQTRLTIVLARAQRLLNERRSDDVRFLEAAVKRSMQALNKAHAATRQGIEELGAATQEAHAASRHGIAELNAAMQEAHAASRQGIAELDGSVQRAVSAIGQTTSAANREIEAIIASVAEASADAASAARASGEATSRLTAASQALATSTGDALGELTSGVAGLSSSQQDATRAVTTFAELGQTSSSDLRELLRTLTETLRDHESALQGQASELTRSADYAGRILNQLNDGTGAPDLARP